MTIFHDRAAWIEIDLGAIRNNYRLIRDRVGAERQIIAVVKADAYGHGVQRVARLLQAEGADMLAVASCRELADLRADGVDLPVLVLGHVPPEAYAEMIFLKGAFTLFDLEQAAAIDAVAASLGERALVHVKADTGMGRLGFLPGEAEAAARQLLALRHLDCCAAFSHLAAADTEDDGYVRGQQQAFADFLDGCSRAGLEFPLRHLANSAAICQWPDTWYQGVRPGIILYGCPPSGECGLLPGLLPAMSVHGRIVRLKWLPVGSSVGYGCTWQARRPTLVATLPFGYADGIPRLLSNTGSLLVCGRPAPIIGRVCMDQLMVDVTGLADQVEVGSEAVLIGDQGQDSRTAQQVAQWAQTINYEVLCAFRARLERVYRNY